MDGSLTGQEIDGYIIGPLIGGGGMGQVYQAYTPESGTLVAFKVLRVELLADNPDLLERFQREIRLMASLQHDNIVPILDNGLAEGLFYFTMKLIGGVTLSKRMVQQPFTPTLAWQILEPIANGLEYMHRQGVYHRDIKPDNIILERQKKEWHVYLGDLGLSKQPGMDISLTQAGSKIGTIEYMSMEALWGDKLDHRADIYSLAVVLYEMLLGCLPFKFGRNPAANIRKIVVGIALIPTTLRPDFPLPLEKVLTRGLEKDRDDRYQSVQKFADDYYQALMDLSEDEQQTEYQVDVDG